MLRKMVVPTGVDWKERQREDLFRNFMLGYKNEFFALIYSDVGLIAYFLAFIQNINFNRNNTVTISMFCLR